MSGSKGTNTNTVTEKADPWAPVVPYLTGKYSVGSPSMDDEGNWQSGQLIKKSSGLMPEARALYDQGPSEYYGGRTTARMNPTLGAGLDMAGDLGSRDYSSNQLGLDTLGGVMTGSDPTSQYYNSVMGGDYMGGGDFMSAYGDDIMDNVGSQFAAGGRSFSPAHAGAATKQMGGVASRLYDSERDRQMQAASGLGGNMMGAAMAAPGIENQMYGAQSQDINAMTQSGLMQRGIEQERLDAARQKWDFEQNADWDNLNRYSNMITNVMHGAPAGGTTTTNTPYYTNPYGDAATGAAAGSMFGPWGALAGGVLGYYGGSM